jgi:hypothetical protein
VPLLSPTCAHTKMHKNIDAGIQGVKMQRIRNTVCCSPDTDVKKFSSGNFFWWKFSLKSIFMTQKVK